jgi:uncharacterized membrane protein
MCSIALGVKVTHMTHSIQIASAVAALLASAGLSSCAAQVALAKHNAAVARDAPERCFGVARAGRNDCRTHSHVCAGWAHSDRDQDAFVYVPTGTCERLVGGRADAP